MPLLEIQNVIPGMMTEDPVRNAKGQILIAKGSVLSERHLKILKTWGISSIQVIGSESEHPPEDLDYESVREHIENRFKLNTSSHPFLDNLKAILMRQLLNEQKGQA